MTNKNTLPILGNVVNIIPYYQRSISIQSDFGQTDAISGYVCHETAKRALGNMSRQIVESNQRAFTWTGPYGSGKSSLVLTLASALSSQVSLRKQAEKSLSAEIIDNFNAAFKKSKNGWLVLPLVGSNSSVSESLSRLIETETGLKSENSEQILNNLKSLSGSNKYDGVVLIIDEMGKFLESSNFDGDDIYFFQQLAELSSRTDGSFLLIGILHQAFREYARFQQLSEKVQNDWAKVQGRFVDIPLVASADEVVELLGKAISCPTELCYEDALYINICECLKKRRSAISADLDEKLKNCWPLHPITALLLGPTSRRQFNQNERSIFSFLGSSENFGFQEFLRSSEAKVGNSYKPENYWDYLKANFDISIGASTDSHRWATANTAVDKVEAKGTPLHASLIKSIAVIDLFKNGSGLAADRDLLATIFPDLEESVINVALSELEQWKVITYRKYNEAWSIFEGSDFDIELALEQEKSDVSYSGDNTIPPTRFPPVVAKRHLHKTGTLRWMRLSTICSEQVDTQIKKAQFSNNEFGKFLLLTDNVTPKWVQAKLKEISQENRSIALGIPQIKHQIIELCKELELLQTVSKRPELEGDPVGRKEVSTRIGDVKGKLESEFSVVTKNTDWFSSSSPEGIRPKSLSVLASSFADKVFSQSPKIWSELVNRDKLSGNSVKARRSLIYRMLTDSSSENLGITGFPPERGLYLTCLFATGLHKFDEEKSQWGFYEPIESDRNIRSAWNAAYELISKSKDSISCADIYRIWEQPPFGIKSGLMPILLWSLILACKDKVALYLDSVYVPEPTDYEVDLSLQSIDRFELKGIKLNEEREKLLLDISGILKKYLKGQKLNSPLDVARGLVRVIHTLPAITKNTKSLTAETERFRDCILKASDPYKVLFHDIPGAFKTNQNTTILSNMNLALQELTSFFPKLLQELNSQILRQLDCESLEKVSLLQERAKNISGTANDLTMDAFITRLKTFDGSINSVMDIVTLLSGNTEDSLIDQNIKQARNEIASKARIFRELEIVAAVNNRESARQAIAIVYSSPGKDFIKNFDIGDESESNISLACEKLLKNLNESKISREAQFAVLAKAIDALNTEEGKRNGN